MLVWIPRSSKAAIVEHEPTIASKSKPAASVAWADGLNDGFDPLHSSDTDKLFFYWWLKKGTTEWVEYNFDQPYVVSKVQVYWLNFDHYDFVCRPPTSWEIFYRRGQIWVPIDSPSPYTTDLDCYNTVKFTPVKTTGLRISARLQKDLSAGIMEWKVF
jgi:hypothetical protein